jgi:2-polyprenyl-6-methoxyphenol hydroxylase-like FAD-dependent oxidoreductase
MALLDAWSLAQHLPNSRDYLGNSSTSQHSIDEKSLDDVLGRWWKSRRYQLAYVRQLSKFLTPLFQSESKSCELFRDWIMAPTGKLPVFDTLQLKTLASEVLNDITMR